MKGASKPCLVLEPPFLLSEVLGLWFYIGNEFVHLMDINLGKNALADCSLKDLKQSTKVYPASIELLNQLQACAHRFVSWSLTF